MGKAKGRTIELYELLPYPDGSPVRVVVDLMAPGLDDGSPAAILEAVRAEPHLAREDVDELERAISRLARLSVQDWTA